MQGEERSGLPGSRRCPRWLAMLGLALLGSLVWAGGSWLYWRSDPPRVAAVGADSEDLERLAEVRRRFEEAGLELPAMKIRFYTADTCPLPESVRGQVMYGWPYHRVHVCSPLARVLAHEIAHAWVFQNLDREQRSAFMALRGASTWGSTAYPWRERASEHAAEILTWAVLNSEGAVARVSPSTERDLVAAYEFLVGQAPTLPAPVMAAPPPSEQPSVEETEVAAYETSREFPSPTLIRSGGYRVF